MTAVAVIVIGAQRDTIDPLSWWITAPDGKATCYLSTEAAAQAAAQAARQAVYQLAGGAK